MLDRIASMFTDYEFMVSMQSKTKEPIMKKKGKKEIYEINMKSFRENNQAILTEMADILAAAADKEAAAGEISEKITGTVSDHYLDGNKFTRGLRISNLNFYMVYYVFPAILLTGQENAVLLCDTLRDTWNQKLGEQIGYTDYQQIRDGFQEKIFGIF